MKANKAEFDVLPEQEKAAVIERDQETALQEEKELIQSARQQDIETAKRAAESGDGKALESLYKGFFGSRENCELVAKLIPEDVYSISHPTIVDAGSSQGILGNYVREKFTERGGNAELVMIDTNSVAMKNSPVEASKVEGDLIHNPLANESADVVILRSVLQYAEPRDQARILGEIHRVLKPGGVLLSQFASWDKQSQADVMNKLFMIANRRTSFFGTEEGIEMHKKMFDEVESGEGPTLYETFDDFFVTRINASQEVIQEAKKYIHEHVEELEGVLTNTEDPFSWKMPFSILVCRKAK